MNPNAERFIDLASRPLESQPELHARAVAELRDQIADEADAAAGIGRAVDALESADRRPRWRRWRVALGGLALAVSLPVLAHAFWQMKSFVATSKGPSPGGSLTGRELLILRGDPSAGSETGRWRALWAVDTGNPAWLLEYAKASLSERKTFSPDILEAAADIDPDNAWYDVMQACEMAGRGVEKRIPGYNERQRGAKTTFHLRDEAELGAALERLHEAAHKPRFVSTDPAFQSQRIGLLPARTDIVSQYPRLLLTMADTPGSLRCRHLADAISLQAGRLADARDVDGFRRLLADWKWLVESASRAGPTLMDVMVAKAVFTAPLPALTDAARALGLEREAAAFAAQRDRHDPQLRKERQRREGGSPTLALMSSKGSGLHHTSLTMVARQPENAPPLTADDLRPGRLADHALCGRAAALALWVVLAVLAGLAVACADGREPARSLAKRLQSLFGVRDWVGLLACGVIVPLVWAFLVIRLSPFSSREWMIGFAGMLGSGLQLGTVSVLILTASAVAISRRLGKRAGFLGLGSRWPKTGVVALASAALAVPAAGATLYFGESAIFSGAALSGMALLWLVWRGAAGWLDLGKPPKRPLRRQLLARLAVPVLVFAMTVSAMLAAGLYFEERHWIARDWPMEIAPDSGGGTRYEMQATETLRNELLADLGSIPVP